MKAKFCTRYCKLDTCTKEGVLVKYSESKKGYRILHQDTNKVTISRNVIVDETSACSKFHEVTQALQTEGNSTPVSHEDKKQNEMEIEVKTDYPDAVKEEIRPQEVSVRIQSEPPEEIKACQ